jgi:hypothetical protein
MLSTVSDKKRLYARRAYKRAILAQKLQNIIMQPSTCSYQDTIIDYMADCPITKANIHAAADIFGPNLGSRKRKTVRRPNNHIATRVDPVPNEIIEICCEVTIAIDITFVNKVPFFVTITRNIKFGTMEALVN